MNIKKTQGITISIDWLLYVMIAALTVRYFRVDIAPIQTLASITIILGTIFFYFVAPVMIIIAIVFALFVFTDKFDNSKINFDTTGKKVHFLKTVLEWVKQGAVLYFSYSTKSIALFVPAVIITASMLFIHFYKKEAMRKVAQNLLLNAGKDLENEKQMV